MLRRDVIRAIVERDRERTGLTEEVVLKEARVLYAAACKHFGTWETALRYAGVDFRYLKPRCDYSRDRVLGAIRKLCISGYSLSARHNMRRDRQLYRAALRHFGSWRQALEAAGIDLRHAHINAKPRQHDKKQIIETLQQRHRDGLTLCWSEVCLKNRAVATAAKNTFGSWSKALAAAGIAPEPHRVAFGDRWDKEHIVARIQERQRQGMAVSYVAVNKDHPALVSAARRLFGNWSRALQAAGIASEDGDGRSEEG